jgi:hypothetical protein
MVFQSFYESSRSSGGASHLSRSPSFSSLKPECLP